MVLANWELDDAEVWKKRCEVKLAAGRRMQGKENVRVDKGELERRRRSLISKINEYRSGTIGVHRARALFG
jgi:hypothetical protein